MNKTYDKAVRNKENEQPYDQRTSFSDEDIVQMFNSRNEKVLSVVQIKYGRLARQLSYNILHNNEDVEECLNDALLALWNSIPPKAPRSISAFFCAAIRNISLNRYDYNNAKKRKCEQDLIFEELCAVIPANETIQTEEENNALAEVISDFLDRLQKKDRIIFMRRYFYSDPVDEISAKMGESVGSVTMRLYRMRKKLKIYLEKEGIEI